MRRKDLTAAELLTRVLHNKSRNTYWDNVRELHRRGEEETFRSCYQLVKTGSDREKEIGLDILAQLGLAAKPYLKQSLPLYFELLNSAVSTDVLIAVLHALCFNNDTLNVAQLTAIASFRSHADKYVRFGVVHALSGVGKKVAVDAMVELTEDKFTPVRSWATFGIATQIEKKSKQITAALWKRVRDKDEETKFEAIVGLAVRQEEGIKDVLIEELQTESIGALLFEAIGAYGDTDFLPALQVLYKDSSSDKTINPGWLGKLRDAIDVLSSL